MIQTEKFPKKEGGKLFRNSRIITAKSGYTGENESNAL